MGAGKRKEVAGKTMSTAIKERIGQCNCLIRSQKLLETKMSGMIWVYFKKSIFMSVLRSHKSLD